MRKLVSLHFFFSLSMGILLTLSSKAQSKEETRYSFFQFKFDSLSRLPSSFGNDTLRLSILDSIIESPAKNKPKSIYNDYKKIAYDSKWPKGIARYKVFYANSSLFEKDAAKATQLFLEAENELEKLKDYPMQIYALMRLSMLITHKSDSLSAQFYINKAIEIAKKIKSRKWHIKALNYKANTFVYRNRLDLAIPIFEEIEKFKDLPFHEEVVNNLNLGTCYMYTNQVEKGLNLQLNTLKILPLDEHYIRFQIEVRFEIISFLLNKKDSNKAQKIFNELTPFMDTPNIKLNSYLRYYDLGYQINKAISNKSQTLYFLEKKSIYQDSLIIEANKNAELGLKSEIKLNEQRDKLQKAELEKLRTENERQNQFRWFFFVLSAIGLLTTIYVYRTNKKLKKNNQELLEKNAEISEAMLKGQTIERQRVALDLHDNLGSTLSALWMSVDIIDQSKMTQKEKEIHLNLKDNLEKAYNDVRLLSHNLLPEEFEKQGLQFAIKSLVENLNRSSVTKFIFICPESLDRLDHKIEFELYSICLELVNNIMKHSKASEASIELQKTEKFISLTISDNGIGIANIENNGKGMKNVKARVEVLNGEWEISKNPSHGISNRIIVGLG